MPPEKSVTTLILKPIGSPASVNTEDSLGVAVLGVKRERSVRCSSETTTMVTTLFSLPPLSVTAMEPIAIVEREREC